MKSSWKSVVEIHIFEQLPDVGAAQHMTCFTLYVWEEGIEFQICDISALHSTDPLSYTLHDTPINSVGLLFDLC